MKASFLKAVKELENEKRARGIMEQVCDELAVNIGEDKGKVEEMKRETLKIQEEIERESEMLHIAEALREERAHMKMSDAKNEFEEKNAAVDKLKTELETILRSNDRKEKEQNFMYERRDGDLAFFRSEARENYMGEVEDSIDGDKSAESDLHSIELSMDNPSRNYKLASVSRTLTNSKGILSHEEPREKKSIFNQVGRRSTCLLGSVSNIVEWGNGSHHETDKQVGRRSCGDEIQRHKPSKGFRDHALPSSRLGLDKGIADPSGQQGSPWPSHEPCSTALQRPMTMEGNEVRGRVHESRVVGNNARRLRR